MLAYIGKKSDGQCTPFHFNESLSPYDIEISEDMFIITAEEARKLIEPPKPVRIEISPAKTVIQPGVSCGFIAKCFDQHNNPIEIKDIVWEAQGGTFDSNGVFKAGNDKGEFKITATADNLTQYAHITIADEKVSQEPGPDPDPVPDPDRRLTKLKWSGEIQYQQWMHFYTKVLAKHTTAGKLKITLNIEISKADGIAKQTIEETKTGLRELGLSENVVEE